MKILLASLIIMVIVPVMASSPRDKTVNSAPFTTAFAGHADSNGLFDCACQAGTDGISRDCNGNLCPAAQITTTQVGHSAKQMPTRAVGPRSLDIWARALLSVLAVLTWN